MKEELLRLLRSCAGELKLSPSDQQLASFLVLLTELKKWNSKFNLTSIRGDREIVLKHFIDSLTLLSVVTAPADLLDIGSGGGFPSLPLKIMQPSVKIVSVDAVEKKILFQRHAARVLRLEDFSALHSRVENLPDGYRCGFDWVVTRAFSDIPRFASLAVPFLKPHGCMVAMKGKRGAKEAAAAERSLAECGLRVRDCIHHSLPCTGDDRYLVVLEKNRQG